MKKWLKYCSFKMRFFTLTRYCYWAWLGWSTWGQRERRVQKDAGHFRSCSFSSALQYVSVWTYESLTYVITLSTRIQSDRMNKVRSYALSQPVTQWTLSWSYLSLLLWRAVILHPWGESHEMTCIWGQMHHSSPEEWLYQIQMEP